MNDQTDQQLLRTYAAHRSEAAFAELVRRHVDLVYSAALRMVCDAHLAQDVTQAVFVALAQNANLLTDRLVLSGWLHCTAQNLASKTVRTEVRRRAREQEAVAMNELLSTGPDASWEQITPHLDAALGELSEPNRDALLLRYFEKKSATEMAERLGVSAEAAQKRVNRAVERLRESFVKRGITAGASGLAVVISANAVQAAPAGLALTISTAAVLTGTTLAPTASVTATKAIAMTAFQKTLVTATVIVLAGAGLAVTWLTNHKDHDASVERLAQPTAERMLDSNKLANAVLPPISTPGDYSIETIPTPSSFGSIHVNSINNLGQAVGSMDGTNGVVHAFIWNNGVMTDLGTLGGSKALACSINDLGEIAAIVLTNNERRVLFLQTNSKADLGVIDGFAKLGLEGNTYYAPSINVNNRSEVTGRLTVADGNQRSFLFHQGRISYFGLRGDGRITDIRAMNNRGDIAGVSIPGNDSWGVFLWQDGKLTDLKTLGGLRAGANAVNDQGTVVGWANPEGASWNQAHAIVWENGEPHDLNAAGWKNSRATGINNAGEIVGWATTSDNRDFAFLKRGEGVIDLNNLIPTNSGWRLVSASAINSRGQILASARKGGKSHAVLVSPPNLPPVMTTPLAIIPRASIALTAPAQLNITVFERLPDGAFHLKFNGQPHIKYGIEASTNLTTWLLLGEALNQDGQLEFTDRDAPKFPLRFYRVTQK